MISDAAVDKYEIAVARMHSLDLGAQRLGMICAKLVLNGDPEKKCGFACEEG
jgi:hypothetical protein